METEKTLNTRNSLQKEEQTEVTVCDFRPYYKSYFSGNSMVIAQKSDI